MEWTNRVDAKASFAFGIETAIVAAITTLAAGTTFLTGLGWFAVAAWMGLVLLGIAAVFAALVIAPILRSESLAKESRRDHIYFGHLRHTDASELEQRLRGERILPVLSRQVVRMAEINWVKHRRVQVSITLGTIGAGLIVLAVAIPLVAQTVTHLLG